MKKITPVFGPQELFNGASEFVEVIRFNDYSREYLWGDLNTIQLLTFGELKAIPIVAMRRIEDVPDSIDLTGDIDELITPEFNKWWEEEGEFIRSGGGNYERSFAYGAFRYLMPKILGQKQPEPKRWTVEDQKAGRLPEVGSIVMTAEVETKNNIFEFAGVCAGSKRFAVKDIDDGLLYFYSKEMIAPIETPDEKDLRLREKWCAKAVGVCGLGMLGITTLTRIYDALLSGELTTPSKDGE